MRISLIFLVLTVILVTPSVLTQVFADTINWTGNGDQTSFNDPVNWDLNRVPIGTDEILIEDDSICPNPGFVVDLPGEFVVDNSLIMSCEVILALGFDSVFVNNGLFVGGMLARGQVTNNGDFVTKGNNIIYDDIDNNYVSVDRLTIDDSQIFNNYGNLTLNGPAVNSGILNNHGTITNNATIYQMDAEGNQFVNHPSGIVNNKPLATIIVSDQCSNCPPSLLDNNGAINNNGDMIVDCGNSVTGSGTFSGFAVIDMCDDEDSDGIVDDIDTMFGTFSNDISDIPNDGTTSATILDRGSDHIVIVTDQPNPDGIRISMIPLPSQPISGFDTPLVLSQCGGTEVTLNNPDKAIISCGSSIIEAQLGQIEIIFTGTDSSTFTTTLNPPNRIIFEPDSLTFVADSSNTSVITINGDSGIVLLEPGQITSIGSFCGRSQSDYNVITGTEENDNLSGTNGDDLIFGLGGNDKIHGKKGNDCIFGGDGDDRIWGGKGNDVIDAEDGNDKVYANQNDDTILGGNGDDKIHGGQGDDTVDGGANTDKCHGGQGVNSFANCEDTKPKMSDSEDEE